jgi:hypothetical protein
MRCSCELVPAQMVTRSNSTQVTLLLRATGHMLHNNVTITREHSNICGKHLVLTYATID